MIEGVKFSVSGSEMKAHLESRVRFHRERAEFYEQQKEQFASAPTADMSNDPVRGLKEAGKRHYERAELFSFYAAHTPVEETFRLSEHELQSLEFIASGRY
jgi:hypothetical protein